MQTITLYTPERTAPYTPTEVCAIARDAYSRGVEAVGGFIRPGYITGGWPGTDALHKLGHAEFPAPMVERPRVWEDAAGIEFRVVDGELWVKEPQMDRWARNLAYIPTPERVAAWADLYATPTERVPA